MNDKFESPEVDISFYFKAGERTKEFDKAMMEIQKLVNEKQKQRLEHQKESHNDDSK
tara:strand:- start:235 stop:405 length:171 start_codon:yes stop_codon:yes gene_type:complete